MTRLLVLALIGAAACSDALSHGTTAGQVVAVLNTGDGTISLVDATRLDVTTVPVAPGLPADAPVAARETFLVFPVGSADSLGVMRLLTSGVAFRAVRLPANARIRGVAFRDDSLAWVSAAGLGRAVLVDYTTGDTVLSTAVGPEPVGAVFVGSELGTAFFVNSNAPGGAPAGQGWISVRSDTLLATESRDSIPLTGLNPRHVTIGDDGYLYVISAGTPGAADGRLSIVDPVALAEIVIINGLGESPGPAVHHPSGRLLIASLTEGILEVNTATRSLVRGPGAGVRPGGDGTVALAVDTRGRVFAVASRGCSGSGVVHVLSAPPAYRLIQSVTIGLCPSAAALASLPAP